MPAFRLRSPVWAPVVTSPATTVVAPSAIVLRTLVPSAAKPAFVQVVTPLLTVIVSCDRRSFVSGLVVAAVMA